MDAYWGDIAKKMVAWEIQCNLTEGEKTLVKRSTKNSAKYIRGQNSNENRFFDTIMEHGHAKLKELCETVDDPMPGQLFKKKRFYIVTRGEKTENH